MIFGVTGDLARKKLMPAVYDLANRGLLPPGFALVGFARRDWADQDFGEVVHDAVREHARTPFREAVWERLAEGIRFVQGTFDDDDAFDRLARDRRRSSTPIAAPAATTRSTCRSRRASFPVVCKQLARSGLAAADGDTWRRVVIEKPFGHDLASAPRAQRDRQRASSPRTSVFRIDHYLGKETVQNLLALRFANQLYEPIWNANYVDHVQITMAEDIGIGGRAGYYDGIGAARDVIQNHLMQLLALTAMEEPVCFDADDLRAEKIKVLSAVRLAEPSRAHRPRPVRRRVAGRPEGGRTASRRRASRRTPPPRRTPRSGSTWTPAAGRASRSTCGPENGWAAGSPRSPWCSSARRTCRSTRP